MFERLWGRIPAPFTLICCNDYIVYLKKTKNENEKEFGVGPFFQKTIPFTLIGSMNLSEYLHHCGQKFGTVLLSNNQGSFLTEK